MERRRRWFYAGLPDYLKAAQFAVMFGIVTFNITILSPGFSVKVAYADQENSACCQSEFESSPANSGGDCYDLTQNGLACNAMYVPAEDCLEYAVNQLPQGKTRCSDVTGTTVWVDAKCVPLTDPMDADKKCFTTSDTKKTHKFKKACEGLFTPQPGSNYYGTCTCTCKTIIQTDEVGTATVVICTNGPDNTASTSCGP
jgi:hypothetical protein